MTVADCARMKLLIGTDDGLFELVGDTPTRLHDGKASHVLAAGGGAWAIVDDAIVRRAAGEWAPGGEWAPLEWAGKHTPRSLLATDDTLLVGTARAHLYAVGDGTTALVEGFEAADGRRKWHTPWGGPPDTRSLARGAEGTLYANVHVGGVLRSADGEAWQPTMDIDADVHQVTAHPTLAGCALVASAWGLGLTLDGAGTWDFTDDGLHSSYCRAVVSAGDFVLISAADGPSGGRGAIYRRALRSTEPFAKCHAGLPRWFADNIDSGCLVAAGEAVAFGTADGAIYVSHDAGTSWLSAAAGLPPVRALAAW